MSTGTKMAIAGCIAESFSDAARRESSIRRVHMFFGNVRSKSKGMAIWPTDPVTKSFPEAMLKQRL